MRIKLKNIWSWYFINLLAWVVGISGGFNLASHILLPLAENKLDSDIAYQFSGFIQFGIPFLVLIVSISFAHWTIFNQWEVKVSIFKWIIANIKGTIFAVVIFFILGAIIAEFQRPILNFLYGTHLYEAQTPFIQYVLISGMLPLLGSIGTAIMIAVDIFEWIFWKK